MLDKLALKDAIVKSGKKKLFLAKQLDISVQAFSNKCNGKTPFTIAEVKILRKELNLTASSTEKIFGF